MSFKINRSDSATPLLPNSAAPEAKASRPPGSRTGSIYSKQLFPRAPKNSSTSMAPRDTIPLQSAEQRAAPSDGHALGARSGLTKPASSLLNRAGRAMSSGARVVSSGMHQAGKAMSGAYQALNPSSHRPSHSGYVRLEQDVAAHHGVEPGSSPAVTPQRPPQPRPETPLTGNVRLPVTGQGGRAPGEGPAPGQPMPPMPSSRLLASLGAHAGNVPRPAVHHQPAAGGTENANPNISRPSQHAAVKKSLPSFVEAFNGRGSMDRTFPPQHFVEAMEGLAKGTRFEGRVAEEMASNPDWGKQMQQRWNTLRSSVADARDDGNTQVPSLQEMVANRPKLFVRFMLTGEVTAKVPGKESSFDRLMKPLPQATDSGNAPASPATPPQHAPAPLRTQSGNRPQPAAQPRPQPAAHGAENADPNVPRPSPQAAHEKNLQPFLQSFKSGDMNRDFAPRHMLAAMVELARGTGFDDAVSNKMASDPAWGQKMSENWSALRQAVGQARQAGGSSVPSLARIVGDKQGRDDLIRFLATGQGMERLLPQPPAPRPRPRPEPQPRPQVQAQVQVQAQPRPATQSPVRPGSNARPTAAHDTQALRQAEEIVRRGEPSPPDRRDTDREAALLAERYHERPSKVREDEVYASSLGSYEANLAAYNQARALLAQARAPQTAATASTASTASTGPTAAQVAADKARQAELANARAVVAEGRPNIYLMYEEARAQVEHHNSHLSMYEPQDQVHLDVDYATVDKDYDQKLAVYNKAKVVVEAADNPERAAAFKAEVRAEARSMAERAYHADVREAEGIVNRGPVSREQVKGWARDEAAQNYMIAGSEHLDDAAIERSYKNTQARFKEAQKLVNEPLTSEETAARIDAQMAEAERRVRQRQEGADPRR